MRVLHLIETTGPGGAETVCVQLAAGLRLRGHASIAVVHGAGWVADALASAGITPHVMPLGRTPDMPFFARLRRLIRAERIDVIQTHLLTSAMYGSVLGRALGVPVVSTFHGANDFGRPGWRTALKLSALRLADVRVVFVSESLRRSSTATFRFPGDRTSVIHNGVDCKQFAPDGVRDFRSELGLPSDAIVVGALGNVRPAKDYQTLLRAAAELAARSERWRVVIVGDPTHHEALYAELLALRGELHLDDRVTFSGFRSDVARVIAGMDVLACTSTSEGFSLSICQAMASGVPVVSTRCGGPEEILRDNVTGLLVPVGAARDIAAALERVDRDSALRARLVAAALTDVVERFSLPAMVDAYERLYDAEMGKRLPA